MTGNQGLVGLLVGPVLGVLIARLLGNTRLLRLLAGALLGEAVAYVALLVWSRRLLQSILTASRDKDRLVGVVMVNRSIADQFMAYGSLAIAALLIGGLTFLILRAVGVLDS